ncbi:MAG: ATPase, T2SS/T4P/T4SS family [Nitrospira sp.]|nr:ATPase, T2SS/T4P/T4SS family [Nitrospira sp.]
MSAGAALSKPVIIKPDDFNRFKEFLATQCALSPVQRTTLAKIIPAKLYSCAAPLGIPDQRLAQYIAEFLSLSYMPQIGLETILSGILPASFCKQYQVATVRDLSGETAVVLSNPFDWELQDALVRCRVLAQPPRLLIAEPSQIMGLSSKVLPKAGAQGCANPGLLTEQDYNLLAELEPEGTIETDPEEDYQVLTSEQMSKLAKLPPIVKLVNVILSEAVKAGASDIHIEPQENALKIRYRIDGALVDTMKVPKHLQANVISRMKILARMDIAEHRKPQDGRSRMKYEDRRVDLRVSTLPAQFGEKIVIRLLDNSTVRVTMGQLGMEGGLLARYQRLLSSPQGMMLVTGPTGSGKTSTLYASLNWLKSPEKNIITVEDPIEFQVQGLTQVQIDSQHGTSFASGLRSILRQDPNIILVGEIRDGETASVALEASQTGHLLLSTLHTNDSVATITRLLDLGVEPFQVASSVIGILAQRLIRRVCQNCMTDSELSSDIIEKVGGRGRLPKDAVWKSGRGCAACQHTGFKGRMAIHELLEVTGDIRDLIAQRAPDHVIREAARNNGLRGLMEAGIDRAAEGVTTLEEVVRVAPRDEPPAPRASQALPVPDIQQSGHVAAAASVAEPLSPGQGKVSILILEDEQDTQDLLRLILEEKGYEITVAGDGIEGLLHLGRRSFDLILSDINMPNLGGFMLLTMNKQKGITTPVIFLTAESGEEMEQQCLELGAADYIKKPFKKEVLLLRVGRVCQRVLNR